jgi:hypothetical protein
MRLKKQSMREVRDAGMRDREPAGLAAPTNAESKNAVAGHGTPRYYRGALIKPK